MVRSCSQTASHDSFAIDGEQARDLVLNLPEALIVLDGHGSVRGLNREAERVLAVSASDAVSHHWSQVMTLHEEAGEVRRLASLRDLPDNAAEDGVGRHYVLTRRDGSQRVVQVACVDGAALLLRDCTVGYQRLRQLERECTLDHLTNLVNRREFERRLETLLWRAREDGSRHVLMFMDLDRFKRVNDAFGHPAGDALLRQVAEALRGSVRERDTLARLGGDEFGLLMEHCLPAEGLRAANTLRLLLRRRRFEWNGERLSFGISVGLAAVNERSISVDTLWAEADAACYRAKHTGEGVQLAGLGGGDRRGALSLVDAGQESAASML
jgi:diguanylate cyclase (GGDEF)-like protein/PAS domain S-box-containing protein